MRTASALRVPGRKLKESRITVMSEADRAESARRILLQEGAFEASPIDALIQKAS